MSSGFFSLLLLRAQAAREDAVLAALREAGARSPATARPRAELPPLDDAVLASLVARGRVREGAPGTFYEYVAPPGHPPLARLVFFSCVALGMPVFFLWLVRQG